MANIAQTATTEALAGLVERVTFHNPENGFCVLRVKARGQRDLITVVGHTAMISAGEFVQMSGAWVNDRTHGQQFRASFLKASPPTTLEGIERYLGSGMIRGIGPVYAKRLVRGFGEAVFDLIEQQPERLREVTGIGAKRAARIIAGWAEQKVIREIMLFLHANGVGTSRAVRIYKTYGSDAVRVISENPYRLARDIRGIGFRTADQIAAKVGIEKTALVRIRAGISYALAEAMNEGHCGLPVEDLTDLTARLLEVSDDLIATALGLELESGDVVADLLEGRRCVFLAGLYHAEQTIAERLRVLALWRATLAAYRRHQGDPLGRAPDRSAVGRKPARGSPDCPLQQAAGDHRGPRRGQDHPGELNPEDPDRQAGSRCPLRAHGPGSQAVVGQYPDWRRRPSTACWRRTRGAVSSAGPRSILWTAISWSWTRPAWSMCC